MRVLVAELAAEVAPVIGDRDDYPPATFLTSTSTAPIVEQELRAALAGHRLVVLRATLAVVRRR